MPPFFVRPHMLVELGSNCAPHPTPHSDTPHPTPHTPHPTPHTTHPTLTFLKRKLLRGELKRISFDSMLRFMLSTNCNFWRTNVVSLPKKYRSKLININNCWHRVIRTIININHLIPYVIGYILN